MQDKTLDINISMRVVVTSGYKVSVYNTVTMVTIQQTNLHNTHDVTQVIPEKLSVIIRLKISKSWSCENY